MSQNDELIGPRLKSFVVFAAAAARENPMGWTAELIKHACAPQGDNKAFISNPVSAESLVLHYAARDQILLSGRVSETIGREISRRAALDWDCNTLARTLVLRASMESWALPESLRTLAAAIVNAEKPPSKQGFRVWKIRSRDRVGAIALAVLTSDEGVNMRPTRNPQTETVCACDVLAQAGAGLGWASINHTVADEIWRRRARLWIEIETAQELAFRQMTGTAVTQSAALSLLADLDKHQRPSGRKREN